MMKFFIVAILIAFADAGVIGEDVDCIIIHNVNYDKEILKRHVESPYQLAIDHDTNTLFFSFTARSDEMFKSAYLSLKTGEHGIVSGIRGGFANSVNKANGTVYMGGEDGIYQFDYDTKKATNLHIKENTNIWQMFYKNGLYFTTYPEEKAYLYKNGEVAEIPHLRHVKAMLVAVNNDKNLVYVNSSGVFMYVKETHDTILLTDAVANGISADIDGNIYFSTPTGLNFINDKTMKAQNLVKIENIYGVAVESNGNIIYAAEDSIIRLKPSKNICIPKDKQ